MSRIIQGKTVEVDKMAKTKWEQAVMNKYPTKNQFLLIYVDDISQEFVFWMKKENLFIWKQHCFQSCLCIKLYTQNKQADPAARLCKFKILIKLLTTTNVLCSSLIHYELTKKLITHFIAAAHKIWSHYRLQLGKGIGRQWPCHGWSTAKATPHWHRLLFH